VSYRDDAAAAEARVEAVEREVARLHARRLALGLPALRDEVDEMRIELAALEHDTQALRTAMVPSRHVRTALLITCAVLASCLGPLLAAVSCP
jgi:hypothetical protein